MYDFDTLLKRTGTDCTKWDALERDFGKSDLMPFWVADTDFPLFPEIMKSLRERCADDQTLGYTVAGKKFYDGIIHWNMSRHGLSVKQEEITQVPGVVTGISLILMALTREGDKVVINPPVYTPFFEVVKGLDRTLVESPLVVKDGKYTFDLKDLESKLADGAKAYILCSPHNPVGRVWTQEELTAIVSLCRKYDVHLISDEIHYDIVYSGHKHIPLPLIDESAILVTAPSKTFNIAGLKTSYIIIKDEKKRAAVQRWASNLHLYCNLFGLRATGTAYLEGADWVDALNAYLEENAKFTVAFFQKNMPRVKTYMPESTYLMWLDFSDYGMSGSQIERVLLDEASVALNPGEEYGEGYSAFQRLNIAVPRWYLQEGLQRIEAAFSGK